ncbi:MAG: lipoate--protein ligase family protein [Motiliproteus sp.]
MQIDSVHSWNKPGANEIFEPMQGLKQELELLDLVATNKLESGCRIWRCHRAMVVPTSISKKPGFARASQALADQGWPVIIRKTGGDLVPQSPGLLNVSFAFRQKRERGSIHETYQALCRPLITAFNKLGIDAYSASVPGAFCDGEYNLVVEGQKLAGTAQRWRRISSSHGENGGFAVLVHAVILCRDELPQLWRAANDFYRHCGIDQYVEYTKHVSVSDLLPESQVFSNDAFISTISKAIYEELWLSDKEYESQRIL